MGGGAGFGSVFGIRAEPGFGEVEAGPEVEAVGIAAGIVEGADEGGRRAGAGIALVAETAPGFELDTGPGAGLEVVHKFAAVGVAAAEQLGVRRGFVVVDKQPGFEATSDSDFELETEKRVDVAE